MESPDKTWTLMAALVPLFPEHDHYVSVFGGHGADILCKQASKLETFNDCDSHIYNLFAVLQDETLRCELVERLRAAAQVGIITGSQNERVASAITFLTVIGHGLLAAEVVYPNNLVDLLEYVRSRFLGVQIEHNSPYRLVEKLDSQKTLFLVDPPDAMPPGQWRAMLDLFNRVGGHVVLIGGKKPDCSNGYGQWERRKLAGVTVWFKCHRIQED